MTTEDVPSRETVFVWPPVPPVLRQRITSTVPDAAVHFAEGEPTVAARAALEAAAVVFGNVPPVWLAGAPHLRWLQLATTGFEAYADCLPDLIRRRVTVTSGRGIFARPVAETVLGGLLAVHRGLVELVEAKTERNWRSLELRGSSSLLSGSRVLVLGRGSLGSEIGELLGAFGCRVTSLGRDHLDSELDAALVRTDVVVCAVPHTRRTAGLLSRRRLGLLPPGAVVVNVGRGSVLDTDALIDLLRLGVLRAAVLDTTEAEPLPADDPLWTCPGVLLTQHTGGGWAGEWDAKVTLFLDNLERRRAGTPMRNLVRSPAARAVAAAREVIL